MSTEFKTSLFKIKSRLKNAYDMYYVHPDRIRVSIDHEIRYELARHLANARPSSAINR